MSKLCLDLFWLFWPPWFYSSASLEESNIKVFLLANQDLKPLLAHHSWIKCYWSTVRISLWFIVILFYCLLSLITNKPQGQLAWCRLVTAHSSFALANGSLQLVSTRRSNWTCFPTWDKEQSSRDFVIWEVVVMLWLTPWFVLELFLVLLFPYHFSEESANDLIN